MIKISKETGGFEENDDDTIKSHIYDNDDEEIPMSEFIDYEQKVTTKK